MKLFMITGLGSARDLASGKKGAFYNTLEEFHKYWERIDIISPRVRGQESGTKKLFGNVYIHISSWPLVLHPPFFIKKAVEIYKEQKFDLMTVHDFPPFYNGIAARILWQFLKVSYILEIFHIPGYPKAANFKEDIYRLFFKFFIKFDAARAKTVRVMNRQISDFLIESGIPADKIQLIPAIYVDLDMFRPMTYDQKPVTKEHDIIFIGRLEKNKGVDLLIEALNKAQSQIPDIKCLIVGDGSLKKRLLRYCATALRVNVIFHGWAKDSKEIAELINKSKILVMTSYNEGGPRVVVEALACGVPVLATPVGVVPDLLKNGQGGEIIDWKAEDIAQKIIGLLSDSVKYQKYSQDGPEMAKRFERKSAIKNYANQLKLQARPGQVLPGRENVVG